MRKFFISLIVLLVLPFVVSKASFEVAAVARFATCDACGLCPKIDVENGLCTVDTSVKIPGDWKNCVKCLYPELYPASSNPVPNTQCKTVAMKADNTLSSPVKKGRQFTMLGCISSGTTAGFDDSQKDGRGAPTFVQKMLDVIFSLAGGLAFLYLMYGGFIILTSQADPEKLNYGRRLIYGSIVGLILTLGSVFIVNLIGSGFLHIPGFGGAL